MIRTILSLSPAGGGYDALLDYFARHEVLEHSMKTPGFLASELLTPVGGQGPALVTAAWDSEQAYQRWIDDPWRAESNARISSLLDQEPQTSAAAIYNFRLGVGRTPLAGGQRM